MTLKPEDFGHSARDLGQFLREEIGQDPLLTGVNRVDLVIPADLVRNYMTVNPFTGETTHFHREGPDAPWKQVDLEGLRKAESGGVLPPSSPTPHRRRPGPRTVREVQRAMTVLEARLLIVAENGEVARHMSTGLTEDRMPRHWVSWNRKAAWGTYTVQRKTPLLGLEDFDEAMERVRASAE